ncbi:Diguanylate cyclase, GGDEF domain [Amycolatopsis xylanica]|uniref:Diguanylate cyclase, GGDEF domain n=1 Tax=Amycolatopsis xylanica TaxID=589385 RepID=A0A1H2WDU6_9PSEU|nr:DICT sensory domain-containing protein [Amycolatopsis xylanica]SDW78209.1 Diguanylate cyclase, GGDEF domain [Amycolatopsis xylanica]
MPDRHWGVTERAGLLSKRALVIASHAVEHAALAEGADEKMIVFALFQRLPYFEREREVYAKIARRAAVTVVGMVDAGRPDLPHGVTPVLLRADETLAREWSVAVLTPTFGGSVVAQDLDEVDPSATSVEAARQFQGRWGFRRDEAYAEVVRLRDAFGDRLPPTARIAVDEVLRGVTAPAASVVENRTEAALRHLATRLERRPRTESAPLAPVTDPDTGLATLPGIAAWLGASTDTVPLGLILITVDDLDEVGRRHGNRLKMHTEQNIADLIRESLRPLDRAVRLSTDEFLLIQPALSANELADRAAYLERRLKALHATYPFVDPHPRITTLLTRQRPLPIHSLRTDRDKAAAMLWPSDRGDLAETAPSAAWFR